MRWLGICVLTFLITNNTRAQQLVLPGDHADPSVVKIGDTYWASATTSNWFPAFPLLKSNDLLHWKMEGYVFNQLPSWANYYFWAPEISYENGKVFIYYSAHKKGGNLCVGIASADRPEGPYKDHGPLICEEAGSIDAFPMRDENGKLHIIWKEDGNSVKKPTPIWIQELNEERTALIGEKKELFRNDAPWEGNLVEGVSIIKNGEYFYALYAAARCCGAACDYKTGVARAKSLMGPWEKYNKNPILTDKGQWKCPGHGTPIKKDNKFYFMYHAYDTAGYINTGRQGLLQEFKFLPDGWLEFVNDQIPGIKMLEKRGDEFNGERLSDNWQWSVFQNINKTVKKGRLQVFGLPETSGAFMGQKPYTTDYNSTVEILHRKSTTAAGIALIGDEKNIISALIKGSDVYVTEVKDGRDSVLSTHTIPRRKKGFLQMQVRNGKDISFLYSKDGKNYIPLNKEKIDGAYLPPWDRGLRVGVVSKGTPDQKALFDNFEITDIEP